MSEEVASPSAFLLGELRRARSAAGLSQEDLGKTINYSGSQVSAVENGQRPPTRDYLIAIDGALHTGGLFERLQGNLSNFDQAPVWFRDWLVIEREATMIRWFEPLIVPGLLQIEDYTRAIIAGARLVGAEETEQRVGTRMERRRILESADSPNLITVIDEGVLRRCVGSPAIMAAQCDHLLQQIDRPSIQVHVVPASAGSHAGLAGPFILAKGPDFEAAHLDTPWQAQITDLREAVDTLIGRWEALRGEALPTSQTVDLIKDVARSWQT